MRMPSVPMGQPVQSLLAVLVLAAQPDWASSRQGGSAKRHVSSQVLEKRIVSKLRKAGYVETDPHVVSIRGILKKSQGLREEKKTKVLLSILGQFDHDQNGDASKKLSNWTGMFFTALEKQVDENILDEKRLQEAVKGLSSKTQKIVLDVGRQTEASLGVGSSVVAMYIERFLHDYGEQSNDPKFVAEKLPEKLRDWYDLDSSW